MSAIIPIISPVGVFNIWHLGQVYQAGVGGSTGNRVPNVDDLVVDPNSGFLRVTAVDPVTHLSTLVPWDLFNLGGGINQEDIILASGPGDLNEAYRVYVDTNVVPHRMKFDSSLHIYGATNTYVKVFLGTNTGPNGIVISGMYNPSNVLTTTNIPLALAAMGSATNYTIKSPVDGWCTRTIANHDVVTLVVYTADGVKTRESKLVAVTTNVISTTAYDALYITDISLESPFMSLTNNRLLEYPINMLLQSGAMVGVVQYQNGSVQRYPVDGVKFSLLGINNYLATTAGQTVNLMLRYQLANNEFTTLPTANPTDRAVTKSYQLITTDSVGRYTVKIYAIPYWNTVTLRYSIKYFLYNLDRDVISDVTPFITYSGTGDTFNGNLYNQTQKLDLGINLDQLGSGYEYYYHAQTINVTLTATAVNTTASSYFTIEYDADSIYGTSKFAIAQTDPDNAGATRLSVSNGLTSVEAWKDNFYTILDPLFLGNIENGPLQPTHVNVAIGSWQREVLIEDILNPINNITTAVPNGSLVELRFINRTMSDIFELAVAPLIIRRL